MEQKEITVHYVPKKQKKEFSKIWLASCIIISVIFTAFSYILALFNKNPCENLSIAINQILWTNNAVSFMGYTVQNFMRAYSKNKYLTKNEEVTSNDATGIYQ